jgi:pyruvate dehydrogenase (quinone)
LKAPLIHTVRAKEIMPYSDPSWVGGLGMIGGKLGFHAVRDCDLLLMRGTDYPYSDFLSTKGNVIQVDERASAIGRRTPTALGILGSVRPTLTALLPKLAPKNDGHFLSRISDERRSWDDLLDKQSDPMRARSKVYPQAVARMVSDLAKPHAVFVLDTGLNTLWSGNWIRQNGTQRIIGSFNNAAVGTALGQANGIQGLDRSRQVIVMTGDGLEASGRKCANQGE